MARVVRKVSGKAVRGQKKGILYNKNFWIGISCGLVAILALVLGLVFGLRANNSASEVEVEDYFGMTQTYKDKDTNKDVTVNFTKSSYAGVKMHTNPNADSTFVEYVFVFATDLSKFYPCDLMQDDDNLKNENHEAIFEALMILQNSINEHNKLGNDYKVALYIVDTKDNQASDNMSILSDAKFTGGATDVTSLLALVNGDKLIDEFTTEDKKVKSLFTTSLVKNDIQTVVNNARLFINAKFKDNADK